MCVTSNSKGHRPAFVKGERMTPSASMTKAVAFAPYAIMTPRKALQSSIHNQRLVCLRRRNSKTLISVEICNPLRYALEQMPTGPLRVKCTHQVT